MSKPVYVSPEELEEIKKLYLNDKLSTYRIGKMKGHTSIVIRTNLRKLGILIRHRAEIDTSKYDWSDLDKLYTQDKLGTYEIARLKGCTPQTVIYNLKSRYIKRRTNGEQLRIYWTRNPRLHYSCDGYILMHYPSHPHANSRGGVPEHRLIVEKRLGRYLLPSEIVHHINGVKDDNRDENLELISQLDHHLRTKFCSECQVKKDIRLLKWQVKEQNEQIRNLTAALMGIGELKNDQHR